MAQFVPYTDKENSSQLGVLSHGPTAGIRTAPIGKSFGGSSLLSQVGGLRKALGNLNVDPVSQQKTRPAGSKIPVRDAIKPQQKLTHKAVSSVKADPEPYPEIEQMPQYEDPEDNFADVWSPSKRPDSYIEEMLQWRPTREFPYRQEDHSDGEDSLIHDDSDDSDDDMKFYVPNDTAEEIDLAIAQEDNDYMIQPLPPLDSLPSLHALPLDDLPTDSYDQLS